MISLRAGILLASAILLAPTAQAAESDPWESINRPIFTFNDTLDRWALKPLAQGYRYVTPQSVEDSINNLFGNLGEPCNLANNLLQGKVHAAGVDTARFLFNTTLGGLGLFDVATHFGLSRSDEDFGQTLGHWGLGSGPYIVLPLLGPSTPRDTAGLVADSLYSYSQAIDDIPARNSTRALEVIELRAGLLPAERVISGDKYIFVRNAYLQNREFRVMDGQVVDDF